MCDRETIKMYKMSKRKRSKDLKNICSEKIFSKRSEQLLAMMQETFELELIRRDIMNDFKKTIKLLDALKPATPNNKHKKSVQSAVFNTNQKEVDSINFGINDTVLITNKYEKVLVFDDSRALSKTDHHSNNPDNNEKKWSLFNKNENSDKSDSPNHKTARTLSTGTENSNISGSQNKKALVSSNSFDNSDKSAGQSKIMALASSNSSGSSDKSAGPSTKKASSNKTDQSNESDESDKENQTNDNTSQSNKRIPPPVAAPVAQEEEGHEDLVPIGSGSTLIPRDKYERVKWKSYSTATRSLLQAVFCRAVLSTHSLSGKRSPAFPNKPAKIRLDQQKISDIIIAVRERFEVKEHVVRSVITIACADASKPMKTLQRKRQLKPKERLINRFFCKW